MTQPGSFFVRAGERCAERLCRARRDLQLPDHRSERLARVALPMPLHHPHSTSSVLTREKCMQLRQALRKSGAEQVKSAQDVVDVRDRGQPAGARLCRVVQAAHGLRVEAGLQVAFPAPSPPHITGRATAGLDGLAHALDRRLPQSATAQA